MGSPAMTKLDDALIGVRRLSFDTSPVIYFVEANPQYDALVTEIFQRVSNGCRQSDQLSSRAEAPIASHFHGVLVPRVAALL